MKKPSRKRKASLAIFLIVFGTTAIAACGKQETHTESLPVTKQMEGAKMTLQLKSSAFEHEGTIPVKYTCDGSDVSPPLQWSPPPAGTKSLVLICDDPDAPVGIWVHWVIYGISPDLTELPENVAKEKIVLDSVRQGINDFRRIGYGGPCPPAGKPHRYFFKLYALNVDSNWEPGLTKEEVLKRMDGHVLARGELMGKYKR